ncbi:hypothetical protein ABT010_16740 [Streptomyces sp. NPDC002668]|uniref:hypothetical protein n=1 Tax=Streptomyces sp. NPDC002668 TaxID=3154422 RepID=UPI003329A0C6
MAESEDYATAQGFVAAGPGISLMPLIGLGNRHSGVVVRKVRCPEPVRVSTRQYGRPPFPSPRCTG